MSAGLPGEHADALVAALKALFPATSVFLDEVPANPPTAYVVVWSDAATHDAPALGGCVNVSTFHPGVTLVARTTSAVRAMRDRLERLWDSGVTVEGRLCEVERISGSQISRDADIPDRTVWWCRDVLEVRSYAA